MTNAKKLREVFEKQKIVVAPGAYDAYSSMLVQEAGFSAVYLGGFSIAASKIGYPDWGFATMNEMLSTAVDAINIIDVPAICDIDQGFGALTNFVRTVHCYEQAGVAAIHFEDQPFPKKCSQQKNRTIISMEDAVAKIKAAVETRTDPDFMLIARTDSMDIGGMDELKRRMEAYLNAGADYTIFCEHTTEEQLVEVGKEFPGKVIAFVGDTPNTPCCYLPVSAYEEMGYKGLIYCAIGLRSAHFMMKKNFETLYKTGQFSLEYATENSTNLREVERLMKLSSWQALRDKYNML